MDIAEGAAESRVVLVVAAGKYGFIPEGGFPKRSRESSPAVSYRQLSGLNKGQTEFATVGFYGHLNAYDHLVSFAANFHIAKFRQVDLMGF